MITCELCGFGNSPAAKICGKCGSPLIEAAQYESYPGYQTQPPATHPQEAYLPTPAGNAPPPPINETPPGHNQPIQYAAPAYIPPPKVKPAPHAYTPPPGKTSTIETIDPIPTVSPPDAPAASEPPYMYTPPQNNANHAEQGHQPFPAATQSAYTPPRTENRTSFDDEQKKLSLPMAKIAIGVAVLALIVIIAYLAITLLSSAPASESISNIVFFSDRNRTVVSINNDDKLIIDERMHSQQISLDGSKAAVLTGYDTSLGGTLWFVTASELTRIADNVLDFVLADSGDGIAYLTDYAQNISVAALYLYDTAAHRGALIEENVVYVSGGTFSASEYLAGICVSPDGKSVAYYAAEGSRLTEFTGYVSADGSTPQSIGSQSYAVAISNGGRHIYYLHESASGLGTSLHVKSGSSDNRLLEDVHVNLSFILNADYSEAVYSDLDGRAFITRNGGDRTMLEGPAIRWLILPAATQSKSYYTPHFLFMVNGIQAFNDFLALTEQGLIRYNTNPENGHLEHTRIPGASSGEYDPFNEDTFISENGKMLVFRNTSNHLIYLDPTDPAADRKELARNVENAAISHNGSAIYYVDDSDILWHMRTTDAAPTKIAEDVSPQSLTLAPGSNRLFFLTSSRTAAGSGILHYTENAGNPIRVSGADNVTSVWSTPTSVFYSTRNNAMFRSDGTDRFDPFHEFFR